MPAAQSSSLIQDYSVVYTQLQRGKRELIEFGADRVLVNRYVIDAAESTNPVDPEPVLDTVSLEKVLEGDTAAERRQYCKHVLGELVGMQEEVNTLQKVAREKGISAGILTIVGQASVHSPEDNGASVIYQLNELMNPSEGEVAKESVTSTASTQKEITTDGVHSDLLAAANDAQSTDLKRLTPFQKIIATMAEHKTALITDMVVCFFASCFAISLVS